MSASGRKQTLTGGHFSEINKETRTDLPQPPSCAARMDDDREAIEFVYALYLARRVDREAAQMIVAAAEAGAIEIDKASALFAEIGYSGDLICSADNGCTDSGVGIVVGEISSVNRL